MKEGKFSRLSTFVAITDLFTDQTNQYESKKQEKWRKLTSQYID